LISIKLFNLFNYLTGIQMISEEYVRAYENFVTQELELIAQHNGSEYAKRITPYYNKMYSNIANSPTNYMLFDESPVEYFEMEFAESVEPIRNVLMSLAEINNVPSEILFIPRVKLADGVWDSIINIQVVRLIRQLFDETVGEDFETLRLYKAFDRNGKIHRWTESTNGYSFFREYQKQTGIQSKTLVKKLLYLFDDEFVRQQKMWMSKKIWIHNDVIHAFEQWSKGK
jgi:hypothetical protein